MRHQICPTIDADGRITLASKVSAIIGVFPSYQICPFVHCMKSLIPTGLLSVLRHFDYKDTLRTGDTSGDGRRVTNSLSSLF